MQGVRFIGTSGDARESLSHVGNCIDRCARKCRRANRSRLSIPRNELAGKGRSGSAKMKPVAILRGGSRFRPSSSTSLFFSRQLNVSLPSRLSANLASTALSARKLQELPSRPR